MSQRKTTNEEILEAINDSFTEQESKMNKRFDKLEQGQNKLAAEVIGIKEDLKEFATKDELTLAKDEILTAVAGIAKKFDSHQTEHTANQAAHDRIQGEIEDIQKHIGLKTARAEA